jgi:hypothetical protein
MFRKFNALEPNLDIARANTLARKWCLEINGLREHGTTHLKPYEVFQNLERNKLLPLPAAHFEVATWKQAKVHPDQFVQFEKKVVSVPHKYIGKTLWIRGTEKLIEIYDEQHVRIKQYARSHQTRLFDRDDFPEDVRVMLDDQAVQRLLERAEAVGPQFKQLVHAILSPHAMLNYRRALALLNFTRQYPLELLEAAAEVAIPYQLHTPKPFQRLLEKLKATQSQPPGIPISQETQELLRDADYFIHPIPNP